VSTVPSVVGPAVNDLPATVTASPPRVLLSTGNLPALSPQGKQILLRLCLPVLLPLRLQRHVILLRARGHWGGAATGSAICIAHRLEVEASSMATALVVPTARCLDLFFKQQRGP
jgi:hypothetical protein